ncbi:MAG TPA: hypothetical protein VGA56_07110 [Opitutaceae bacterium]
MCDYSEQLGDEHRRTFGQFFTHPSVARYMVGWVLESGEQTVFDPAFGLGAFREALPGNPRVGFPACEVDPRIIEYWEQRTGERATFVVGEDYLRSWGERHRNIVCNPPYMRFQRFEPNDLNRALVLSPEVFASIPAEKIPEAVKAVRAENRVPAWVEERFALLKNAL